MRSPIALSRAVVGLLSAAAGGASPLVAGSAHGGDVAVVDVRFATARAASGRWHETTVEVAVRPAPENATRFVRRVGVELELGYEVPGGQARFEFFRAGATAVAVEQGRAQFRFYLPPEIVERDRLNGDLRYYFVVLSADGEAMALHPKHVGPGLTTSAAVANFRSRVAADAAGNDGALVPQDRTPFARGGSGPPAPSFVQPR